MSLRVRMATKRKPAGWELIESTMYQFEDRLREAVDDPHDGKRKVCFTPRVKGDLRAAHSICLALRPRWRVWSAGGGGDPVALDPAPHPHPRPRPRPRPRPHPRPHPHPHPAPHPAPLPHPHPLRRRARGPSTGFTMRRTVTFTTSTTARRSSLESSTTSSAARRLSTRLSSQSGASQAMRSSAR